jgi:hypothetical protein
MSGIRPFARVATAGIAFQTGSATIDEATIMAALLFQLTCSSVLVGAVTAGTVMVLWTANDFISVIVAVP